VLFASCHPGRDPIGIFTISGVYFAEASLFLNISCILAAFAICGSLDERGEEIIPFAEFEGVGLLRYCALHLIPAKIYSHARKATLNSSSADSSQGTMICWRLFRSNLNGGDISEVNEYYAEG